MNRFTLEQRDILAHQLIHALARREHSGRAPKRLLEPGRATWQQFRGNLREPYLLTLLAEDSAVRFPLPADPNHVLQPSSRLTFADIPRVKVFSWLEELTTERLNRSRGDALTSAAAALKLPNRFAGSNLHKLQPGSRVLELPGTGGQLVAKALEKSPDAVLHVNCTVLTGSWAERAMAGIVAMEFDAPHIDFIREDPDLAWATSTSERSRFDLIFGLQPDKGGQLDAETLSSRFPLATVVLV